MARPEPLNPLHPETLPKLVPLGTLAQKRKEEVEPDRKNSDCDAKWVTSFNLDINKVFALAYAVDERIAVVDKLIATQSKALHDLQVWANQALSGLTEDGPALENQVKILQQTVDILGDLGLQVQKLGSKQIEIAQKVNDLHSWREQASFHLPKDGPELEKRVNELEQTVRHLNEQRGRMEDLWPAYEKKSGPFEQPTTAPIHLNAVNPRGGMPVWSWFLIFLVGILQVVTLIIALKH